MSRRLRGRASPGAGVRSMARSDGFGAPGDARSWRGVESSRFLRVRLSLTISRTPRRARDRRERYARRLSLIAPRPRPPPSRPGNDLDVGAASPAPRVAPDPTPPPSRERFGPHGRRVMAADPERAFGPQHPSVSKPRALGEEGPEFVPTATRSPSCTDGSAFLWHAPSRTNTRAEKREGPPA